VAAASRSLHLGLTPWRNDWDGPSESLAEQAVAAEKLGFESFWLPESHFSGRSSNPAPLLRLAAVAAVTSTLRVATTSFLLPVRHPIHVAEEVAVLDRLSRGRVILGVGRGFRRALFTAFDVPRAEKRDRFEAALAVILDAWRGEPVAWEGEGETPVVIAPTPVQQPHPPVWVAAFGPKAVTQAGRLGLPYLASPIEPISKLEENYALHRETLALAGKSGEIPVPIMRSVFVSDDEGRVRDAREALARQAAAMARAPLGAIGRAVDEDAETWALVGSPAQVRERIDHYREKLGMTHLVARAHIPGVAPEAIEDSLSAFASILD
jgi:alkanesulfonate monooxygenase SsuD/methylene tetrahydromethanopterin reductase-like flavin-dependent oxidoreductase (luciferase family)